MEWSRFLNLDIQISSLVWKVFCHISLNRLSASFSLLELLWFGYWFFFMVFFRSCRLSLLFFLLFFFLKLGYFKVPKLCLTDSSFYLVYPGASALYYTFHFSEFFSFRYLFGSFFASYILSMYYFPNFIELTCVYFCSSFEFP